MNFVGHGMKLPQILTAAALALAAAALTAPTACAQRSPDPLAGLVTGPGGVAPVAQQLLDGIE